MGLVRALITSPWLALLFRLYVGGIFIYASMNKINYAATFADTIANYQILPYWAVNLTAATLPWLELLCGTMLVIGVRAKAATICIGGMLLVFCVAIAINLIQGTPIGCGCFSNLEDDMSIMTLVRDIIWLGMTVHIYFFDKALQLERRFLLALRET
jgi:putative oxidoreductase